MQLGVRWRAGDTPHRSVPPALHAAIAEQESAWPDGAFWTLTWLEGRPRCELDDLVLVTLTAAGEVAVESEAETGVSGTTGSAGSGQALADDDDDDWLS
ncbi:MAG: Fe-S oxidoreductase [Leucobacter sp.]